MNSMPPIPSAAPGYPRWSETLRDRSHVLIRPITPQDREAERDFIEGLSSQSCRYRFLGAVRHPSEELISRLTGIDRSREAAFVAVVPVDGRQRIIGVSRFSADAAGQHCECAVTVSDEWQHKGLGTLLMRHLIDIARERGIQSMYSIDSAENVAMQDLARYLGFDTRVDPDDPTQVIHEIAL